MTTASIDARLPSSGSRTVTHALRTRWRAILAAPCDFPATCSVVPMSGARGPGLLAGIATMLSPAALCGLLVLLE